MERLTRSINIEIHPERCKSKLTFNEAVQYCKGLGEGWRLPTISEMFYLYEDKIITGRRYWSNTKGTRYDEGWTFRCSDSSAYSRYLFDKYFVLAVRDITE